ncbi:MAG: hypothetical protein K0R17_968 [Rariglobus sp.]|jgi:LmbE family N-acetylglucosaminyl deacetylase|nr:hypothetical protein [Rariglobus sp.]
MMIPPERGTPSVPPEARIKLASRCCALAMVRLLLRLRSRPLTAGFEGPVLIIAPHPDDETLGCGALIHHLVHSGVPCQIAFLTDGGASHPGHPALDRKALVARRTAEARLAAARLGLHTDNLHFLGLPDGEIPYLANEENACALISLRTVLIALRPAVVLLPWRHDGSSEHEAAFTLVHKTLAGMRADDRPRILEFPVWAAWSPRLFIRAVFAGHSILRGPRHSDGLAAKHHALTAYASQFEPVLPWTRAVLPAGFDSAFTSGGEFFFETTTSARDTTTPSLIVRALRRIRFQLWGRRLGLGQPVPESVLDHEYSSGAWNHFFEPEELPRHQSLTNLIRLASPRPRLLDAGCGSGRLASLLDPASLQDYLGVDISHAGLERARALHLPFAHFKHADFETWTPEPGHFDIIIFNECLGYAADPLRTARRFASSLAPGGCLIVSQFQSTNHVAFWRRLSRSFIFIETRTVALPNGKTWDLRTLRLRA